MLWTPSDTVNIFIVFLLLQGSVFLLLCGILPQSVGMLLSSCKHGIVLARRLRTLCPLFRPA